MKVTLELSDTVAQLLAVLQDPNLPLDVAVRETLLQLADHAQQGVYRPGAWERMWLCQAFSDAFEARLEPGDPYGRPGCESIFQRPKQSRDREGAA